MTVCADILVWGGEHQIKSNFMYGVYFGAKQHHTKCLTRGTVQQEKVCVSVRIRPQGCG